MVLLMLTLMRYICAFVPASIASGMVKNRLNPKFGENPCVEVLEEANCSRLYEENRHNRGESAGVLCDDNAAK